MPRAVHIDQTTSTIIDSAIAIHRRLGPGLLESVYEALLARSLIDRGLSVERQRIIPLEIDGMRFSEIFRADLVVEQCVLVELKALEKLDRVHAKQVITYLRLSGFPVGLLLNFGAPLMKDGIKRFVNGFQSDTSMLLINQALDNPE